MIRAYRLYTGPDGHSHVSMGSVRADVLVNATSIHFKETAAHSTYDWHNDPVPQYVVTLSGILEFTTKTGETFTVHPRDRYNHSQFYGNLKSEPNSKPEGELLRPADGHLQLGNIRLSRDAHDHQQRLRHAKPWRGRRAFK